MVSPFWCGDLNFKLCGKTRGWFGISQKFETLTNLLYIVLFSSAKGGFFGGESKKKKKLWTNNRKEGNNIERKYIREVFFLGLDFLDKIKKEKGEENFFGERLGNSGKSGFCYFLGVWVRNIESLLKKITQIIYRDSRLRWKGRYSIKLSCSLLVSLVRVQNWKFCLSFFCCSLVLCVVAVVEVFALKIVLSKSRCPEKGKLSIIFVYLIALLS